MIVSEDEVEEFPDYTFESFMFQSLFQQLFSPRIPHERVPLSHILPVLECLGRMMRHDRGVPSSKLKCFKETSPTVVRLRMPQKTHVCPTCKFEADCKVSQPTTPHECPKCGTNWLQDDKGGTLIV